MQDLTDELNLKAITALGTIISDEERGLITKAQAATGVRAIFDTVGGLVPTDTFDLISAAALRYRNATAYDVDLVKCGDHIKGVVRVVKSSAVLQINHALPHTLPKYDVDREVAAESRQIAKDLLEKMRSPGTW